MLGTSPSMTVKRRKGTPGVMRNAPTQHAVILGLVPRIYALPSV
jgi:hypothetical protein